MNTIMHDMKMQIGQLANSVRGNMSVVTLRSGKELHDAPQLKSNPTDTKSKPDQQARTALLPSLPRVEINIPLLDAIKQVPKYAKFLKELCIHKRKKLKAGAEVGGVLSAFIQNGATTRTQPALSRKCKDLGIFSVPCTIGDCTFADAMLDLGASINVMPALVYKFLNFRDLEPTSIVIQLANRSVVQPVGILEDVLVQVNKLIFLADFYVLDMEDEMSGKGSTVILG
ncbi:hypothetical protein CR513_27664, partial [Mucuna pruriens]